MLTRSEHLLLQLIIDFEGKNNPATAFSLDELVRLLLPVPVARRSLQTARKGLLDKEIIEVLGKAIDHSPIIRCTSLGRVVAAHLQKNNLLTEDQSQLNSSSAQKLKKGEEEMGLVLDFPGREMAVTTEAAVPEIKEPKKQKEVKKVVIPHAFSESGVETLPPDWLEYAQKNLNRDPYAEFEYFKEYWAVRAENLDDRFARKKNWRQTWQLWCLRYKRGGQTIRTGPNGKTAKTNSKEVNTSDFSAGWSS